MDRPITVLKGFVSIFVLLTLLTAFAVAAANSHSISIKDQKFDPTSVDAKVGDTIVFTNNDDRDHSVSSSDGTIKSDNLRPGATYSVKLTKSGKITFNCTYHPREKGTITVSEK
jgi:plastocyanin